MSKTAAAKKKGTAGKGIRLLLLLLFGTVFMYSLLKVTGILSEYKKGEDIYENVRSVYGSEKRVQEEEPPREVREAGTAAEEAPGGNTDAEAPVKDYSAYEHPKKLDFLHTNFDYLLVPRYVFDFEALKELNPEVLGWIMIEGTYVDYPVVQGADNVFYLRHAIGGEENNAGSVFADYRHETPFFEKNTILYAHNQRNLRMFHQLLSYEELSYLNAHPYVDIYLPDGSMQIYRIYSCHLEAGTASYAVRFQDTQVFSEFIAYTKETSLYDAGVPVFPEDRILTLVTCTDEADENRVVLHAVLVDELMPEK